MPLTGFGILIFYLKKRHIVIKWDLCDYSNCAKYITMGANIVAI
jgi:hypothetical protein